MRILMSILLDQRIPFSRLHFFSFFFFFRTVFIGLRKLAISNERYMLIEIFVWRTSGAKGITRKHIESTHLVSQGLTKSKPTTREPARD